jgi:thiamine transporter ThiT
MPMNPTSIIFVLIRAILIVVGLASFVLSFFHGADINLGTLVGLSMVAISLSPYETSNSKTKIWGIFVSIVSFILYSYLLKTLLQSQLSSNEGNAINFLIIS